MEIDFNLTLEKNQEQKLITHSFLNVISIIISISYLIEAILDKKGILAKNIAMAEGLVKLLDDEKALLKALENFEVVEKQFKEELFDSLQKIEGAFENPEVKEEFENIDSIFDVIHRRIAEIIPRLKQGVVWKSYELTEIEKNFFQFFDAVEKNAKGRYRIIFNLADKNKGDYLVHFSIESLNKKSITIPDILIDIMRDLIANARKYTQPGGTIDAGLIERENEIRFVVKDNGIGIPENEIEKVVEFGYRGSNTESFKTFGAGFGLTKAYQFIKNAGGQFWIDSKKDLGTTVSLTVPKP